jgi:hypothetical protein
MSKMDQELSTNGFNVNSSDLANTKSPLLSVLRLVNTCKSLLLIIYLCKHTAYYNPPNVHIYSLLAEQPCCSAMSLLV